MTLARKNRKVFRAAVPRALSFPFLLTAFFSYAEFRTCKQPLLFYCIPFFRGKGRGDPIASFFWPSDRSVLSLSLVPEPQMRLLVGVARMDEGEKEPGGAPLFLN